MTTPQNDDGVEDLAHPSSRSAVRRLRLDLAFGAAVLLVILILVKHGSHDGKPGSSPAPTSSVTPQQTPGIDATPAAERPAIFPVPNRQAGDLASCPSGYACPVAKVASAGIQRALEAAFPGAHIVSGRTVRTVVAGYGQAIWAADVVARAGDEKITVRLQPLSPADPEQHSAVLFGGHSITRWEGFLSQLRVVINVVAPADHPASLAAVEQLAHDTRMLSPW